MKPLSEHCPGRLSSDTFPERSPGRAGAGCAQPALHPCPASKSLLFCFRFKKFSPDWKERRQKNNLKKKKAEEGEKKWKK